ncbi:MAG: hypothetical protein CMJ51_00280 [Planctomycetaceae bacterium]|nr:hypothetical protein [Planctomycetaceae bacterium]
MMSNHASARARRRDAVGGRVTGGMLIMLMIAVWSVGPLPAQGVGFSMVSGNAGRDAELERRLERLDPNDPQAYFELAEDLAEGVRGRPDVAVARRLFGLAGRLDPEKYAASAALALASLESDSSEATKLRAAATLLPGGGGMNTVRRGGRVDPEMALSISTAFGAFSSGRPSPLRRLLADRSVRRILESWDDVLPGGVDWLQAAADDRPGSRTLALKERLLMIHLELSLLERGHPDWSTLLAIEGDPPLLEVDSSRLEKMLLDEERLRPLRRDGRWVEG